MSEITQNDGSRKPGGHQHHTPREHSPQPEEKPQESDAAGLDDETEQDRRSHPSRSGGHGKPPRRIIEEWANDPYCE